MTGKVLDTVGYLNSGKIPVIAAVQPIFALVKYIQWEWPIQYGEDKIAILFGGLHIFKIFWRLVPVNWMDIGSS